jgi:hypothetical protein
LHLSVGTLRVGAAIATVFEIVAWLQFVRVIEGISSIFLFCSSDKTAATMEHLWQQEYLFDGCGFGIESLQVARTFNPTH